MSNDKSVRLNVNADIRVPQVRLISADGHQVGIVPTREALQAAVQAELDLVEVSPTAQPPVCRIMDYKKYRFELNKKAASARKKQRQQLKEIKFRPVTEEGDYQVKLRSLIRFLQHGDKAKVTLRFRGREMAHMELGVKLMTRVQQDLEPYGTIEQMPKLEGRQMVMVVNPKKGSK